MLTYFEDEEFTGTEEKTEFPTEECEFLSCTFTGLNLSEKSFKNTRLVECSFKNCNLSNIDLTGSSLRDVSFEDCKLVGVNFSNTTSSFELSFHRSVLHYCVFQELKIQKSTFKKCDLKEADFTGSDLKQSNFSETRLQGCHFSRCNLSLCDFREATDYSINFENNNVKKSKFSLPEAMTLLDQFDVEIE
ncbi:MAG: pentapeptide repeat-containing protein [Halobacteriovoraceae bacterium]|nr:pentapeptide repeat-containing protein [Halobacteriovoraceae bacterium]